MKIDDNDGSASSISDGVAAAKITSKGGGVGAVVAPPSLANSRHSRQPFYTPKRSTASSIGSTGAGANDYQQSCVDNRLVADRTVPTANRIGGYFINSNNEYSGNVVDALALEHPLTTAAATASEQRAPTYHFNNNNLMERSGSQRMRGSVDDRVDGRKMEQLSRAKLKATSRTSALLAGFAMVALVELDYQNTPKHLLIILGVVTTLLVSVHLLALMMSTCILPHLEVTTTADESPWKKMRWYIELSWFFSTCLGLLLFLLEIAVVFWVKFGNENYYVASYITTAMLVPVFIIFLLFTLAFYRKLMRHQWRIIEGRAQFMRDYYMHVGQEETGNNVHLGIGQA